MLTVARLGQEPPEVIIAPEPSLPTADDPDDPLVPTLLMAAGLVGILGLAYVATRNLPRDS